MASDDSSLNPGSAGTGSFLQGASESWRSSESTARPPDHVGPFRILEKIGEGGFGVVYLAERREPMVQRVALKIIKPGMDSRSVIARFEQERQALAVMDHPNVAKVLDGGVTEGGSPYFVMEHVKGEPITAYCDRQRLTIKQRLGLYLQVCNAVQHAHMKGNIHRDIKPSNVLVEQVGQGGVVKVIDFGVAKAVSHSLTDKTIFTERGQIIGTPEYMSPEQAEMGLLDIDTRTDVYSLGVVLYELLSGTLPFDAKTLRSAGYAEIQRIIREVEPPRPSTRLSTVDDQTGAAIARARQADREKIAGELRRELEWIPLKAMRKDRARRYASAESLGADVRRYLEGLPLEAAPESRGYLLRKFLRRNRVQVIAGSAVALAVVAGVAATGLTLRRALLAESHLRIQLGETEKAQKAEEARADELKQVSDFQLSMLSGLNTARAGAELIADVRKRFAGALEREGQPESERARLERTLQDLLGRVNATDIASAMIDRTILQPAVKAINERFQAQPVVDALLRQALANLYHAIGLYDAAYPLQESALATRRRVLSDMHRDTLDSISRMGVLLRDKGDRAGAEPFFREAREGMRRWLGEDDPSTITSTAWLGLLLLDLGRPAEAQPFMLDALEKRRRIRGEEHEETIASMNNVAEVLRWQEKYIEVEPYWRGVMEQYRRSPGEEHQYTLLAINNMGWLLLAQGRLAEAEPLLSEALEKRLRVLGSQHPSTLVTIITMGDLRRAQGNFQEAVDLLAPVESVAREKFTGDHAPRLAQLLTVLGRARVGLGYNAERFARAESDLLEAQSIYATARRPFPRDVRDCLKALADFYAARNIAEPGSGYDAKAAEWKARLVAAQPDSAETPSSERK